MSKSAFAGTAVLVVLCFSLGYAQENPRNSGADSQNDGLRVSNAKSPEEVERELFGQSGARDFLDGYTSHFNFDNRSLGSNPPTTNKLRCYLECKLDDGRTVHFTNDDLRRVNVGELDLLDVNRLKVRVIACRFWWKLRTFGDWYHSDWVRARPDHYIVYAFLVWRGTNDFERPVYFFDEPLADAIGRVGLSKSGETDPPKKR